MRPAHALLPFAACRTQAGLLSLETRGAEAVHARMCDEWAHGGECERNPGYMAASCQAACARREARRTSMTGTA